MKIFAAGISTETNTFSPIPTVIADFAIQRGRDVLAGRVDHPSLNLYAVWGEQAEARGDELHFGLMAFAQPAGLTVKSTYETLRNELLAELRGVMPVDAVLLMLHGAMVADGYDDCEENIIRHVRRIVGPKAVIGVELDLHCHLSASKIADADIVITYKEYPHVDVNDRARELFELVTDAKLGRIRPTTALFDCQMIGFYPTTRPELRAFVDAMTDAEKRDRVLSISFGHGFQCADLPHVGAKILVVTDHDLPLAERVAREFGLRVYALRRVIGFEALSLPLNEALSTAIASSKGPVVVADQSDNVGGGAPGDATYALRWLVDHHATDVAMAIHYDPEVVKIARQVGIGGKLTVRIGGKMGPFSGDPIDMEATVLATLDDYQHAFPQLRGAPWMFSAGDVVALRYRGIDIVLSSKRCQCFSPSIFSDLGIEPRLKRVLVAKSYQHFYGAFAAIAAEVIYMAAPGAVAPDPRHYQYLRLKTNRLYPWVEDPLSI